MTKDRVRKFVLAAGMLTFVACSKGVDDPSGTGGQGVSGQGGSGPGGITGAGGGTVAATGGIGSGGAAGGSGGATSAYANVGVCGERGAATADATSFDGYEERYIIGEQGFGVDVCAVHFDLTRVGDAPAGCTVCTWTHLVEYSNPSVVTDASGVCAKSDLGLDATAIAKIVGSRGAIGFAKQLGGAHGSARMKYINATSTWEVDGNATWNEPTKAFKFDYRTGVCGYGP